MGGTTQVGRNEEEIKSHLEINKLLGIIKNLLKGTFGGCTHTHTRTHSSHSCSLTLAALQLQFSFSFVETHAISAVKIRPQSLVGWSEEESEEDGDSKNSPIIQSDGVGFPWNIDGELVEIAKEVLVRYADQEKRIYSNIDVCVANGHPTKRSKKWLYVLTTVCLHTHHDQFTCRHDSSTQGEYKKPQMMSWLITSCGIFVVGLKVGLQFKRDKWSSDSFMDVFGKRRRR